MFLLAVLASGAAAQERDEASYVFQQFGVEHGLPSERVTAITQDAAGYLWVGTRDGLARLDGVRSRVWRHQPGSTDGLPANVIGALHVDAAGTLWVGTSNGLARFDAEREQFHRFAEVELRAAGLRNFYALASDDGGLWTATPSGIHRVRLDGRTERLSADVGLRFVTMDDGDVWIPQSACRLRDRPVRCQPVPTLGTTDFLTVWREGDRTLAVTVGGDVWEMLPTTRRVARWSPVRRVVFGPSDAVVASSRYWLSTVDGLFVYDIRSERLARIRLESRDIRSLFVDRQQAVWVASDRGLYRFGRTDPAFEAMTEERGLPDPRVNGITTLDGDTYVATNGGLFRRSADGRWRGYFEGDLAYAHGVWQVTPGRGGGLWVGGKAFGLRKLSPETGEWEQELGPASEPDANPFSGGRFPVRAVRVDGDRVWVGASAALAVRTPGGEWMAYTRDQGGGDGLPSSASNIIHIGDQGRVWIGTDAGLVEASPEGDAFRQIPEVGRPVIWDIAESPSDPGALWLATVGNGACRYVPETGDTQCYTTTDGLPSNGVHRIEAGAGVLWFGTDRGLVRFDPTTAAVTTFSRADGLHGDVIDLMSSHRGEDGRIYVGGPGGYTVFDPEAVAVQKPPPPPRFTSLVSGSRAIPGVTSGDRIRLGPDARRFSVSFATLDFTAPRRNRYRYRLHPLEAEWTNTNALGAEARYSAIPPGEYVFEVQGSGHSGAFTPEPARLMVSVPPRWWERAGVQATGVLALIGAVAGIGWGAVKRSERKRREAAEVAARLAGVREAERLRLARDLHDGAMQHLYRTGHDLDRLASSSLASGEDRAAVVSAREGLNQAAGDLRAVLSNIRPPHLSTLGVGGAIEAVARPFRVTYPEIDLVVDLQTTGRSWPPDVQTAAFRIVQEALSNAGRHAGASTVRVALREERAGIVEVEDDGRGFDTSVPDVDRVRASHFGLAGLRERAEAAGGDLTIQSAPGRGTVIRASLPLNGRDSSTR